MSYFRRRPARWKGRGMIALDLDGTLIDYSPEGPQPRANPVVLDELRDLGARHVAICTNQGGLCFGVLGATRKDGRGYPTPADFMRRIAYARLALLANGIVVAAVRVSCYHPAAVSSPQVAAAIQRAARQLRDPLLPTAPWRVFTTAAARKPQPLMLRSVGATEYWGDSDEDAAAATAAGIPFVRVERFR